MSEIPEKLNRTGSALWRLALPDWGHLDTVWERRLPFALWQVGEQPLIFHWLDAAVDQGKEKVVLQVADRPDEIRRAVDAATLWPIEIEVASVPSVRSLVVDDIVNRLPMTDALETEPGAGWGLIRHWHGLEQAWLERFTEETASYGPYAAIGRNCEIASDATLSPPFWLGNHVSIGPGSVIGPGTVVEDGCIVAGNSRIVRAHLAAHTYLGPETDLIDAVIHRNNLLNIKREAYVQGLESFVASGLTGDIETEHLPAPSLRDRVRALRLLWRWRANRSENGCFTGIDGLQWPSLKTRAPEDRGPWLKLVVQGKMPLFGITPRQAETLEGLPEEWQLILRKAPAGAFSYADVMDAPDPGEMDEALHCVYQATNDADYCRELFDNWVMERLDGQTTKRN